MTYGDGVVAFSTEMSSRSTCKKVGVGCLGLACFIFLIFMIILLTGFKSINQNEQFLVIGKKVRYVENGPGTFWVNPFVDHSIRKSYSLDETEYVVVDNMLTGAKYVRRGPGKVFLGAWEEADEEESAVTVTLVERLLVLDKLTGNMRVIDGPTLYFREAYEEVEKQELIKLAPHESIVVRFPNGTDLIHHGPIAMFLPPYSHLVEFHWKNDANMEDNQTFDRNTRIDSRILQIPFWYDDVRTSDNIEFEVEGIIFWQIVDVAKMVAATSDPRSDLWHHLRTSMAHAANEYTYTDFIANAKNMSKALVKSKLDSSFYESRGIAVFDLDLIEYELADEDLEKTLVEAASTEAVKRANRMQAQLTENAVREAQLNGERAAEELSMQNQRQAEINAAALKYLQASNLHNQTMLNLTNRLEHAQQEMQVLQAEAASSRVRASIEGVAAGVKLGNSIDAYLIALNESLPDVESRVKLYEMHQEHENKDRTTANLASGSAQLILTPESANLHLGSRGSSAQSQHTEL